MNLSYDLIAKAGSFTVLALMLFFLMKNYIDSQNKQQEAYKNLVENVRNESKEREEKLMVQLDKCTNSLQDNTESLKEISKNMKVIPKIQEELKAIPIMQEDISYLKHSIKI